MSDMNDIRDGVLERLRFLNIAIANAEGALSDAGDSASAVQAAWEGFKGVSYEDKHLPMRAIATLIGAQMAQLREDRDAAAIQFAKLFARDVIAPVARESTEPVVFITGNRFMPPLRDFEEVDEIYHMSDDVFSTFFEAFEDTLAREMIFFGTPEDDNCHYVVDHKRWTYVGDDENLGPSLNDEWAPSVIMD